jgi:hypothetical protein
MEEPSMTSRIEDAIGAEGFKIPGTLGGDDATLVKEAILLPMILTLLERDRQALVSPDCPMRFGRRYAEAVLRAMDMVTNDNAAVRRELRKREVKIHRLGSDRDGVRYIYVHRGYERTMALSWNYIKAQISVRVEEYARAVFAS